MSTQINARSPFYIEAEEPAAVLGTFNCDVASLSNFSVSSSGTITEPNILRGTIISREHTSFAENTSGSPISRSVDYTIKIPAGYSNTSDGTFVCTQTFDQPSRTAAEDPAQNDNCPTFGATDIPDITGLTSSGSTVSLGTYFSEGADASISHYTFNRYGDSGISVSFSGTGVNQTATFKANEECLNADFSIVAHNASDACVAQSNVFSVAASCTRTLHCTTDNDTTDAIGLVGGSIEADGTINKPSHNAVVDAIKRIEYNGNTITSHDSNGTGSARDVTLDFIFDIPDNYSNSGDGEISCSKTFSQEPTSAPAATVACGDDIIRYEGIRIASTGDIVTGGARVTVGGTSATFEVNTKGVGTDNAFPVVSVKTPRDIGVDITVPSGYANADSVINCTITREQPAEINRCAGYTYLDSWYLTAGVADPRGHCGAGVFSAKTEIKGVPALGNDLCRGGVPFNGRNLWYGASQTIGDYAGDTGGRYMVVQIDENGIVRDVAAVFCASNLPDDAFL